MNFLQSLSLISVIIFYIAWFLLLPYGIYLLWKKRKKTGILVIGIFVISIIITFIYVDDYYGPEFECLIQAEDETQCSKENNFEYDNG
jgi:hypothetical protein